MFNLKKLFAKVRRRNSGGFSLLETTIALTIALISIMGAYGMTMVLGKHYKGSTELTNMYRDTRVSIEKMFKEISETSDKLIEFGDGTISFASARDSEGVFQLRPHRGIFISDRPDWQKAIIYYLKPDEKNLYRVEVPKTNWDTNYDVSNLQSLYNLGGKVFARKVDYIYFNPVYTGPSARFSMINVTMEFSTVTMETSGQSGNGEESGAVSGGVLSTRVPIMNRQQ